MAVVNYHCPSCDGPLNFDTNSQKVECPYCGSKYEIEAITRLYEKEQASNSEPKPEDFHLDYKQKFSQEEQELLQGYVCPSCAAEIIADKTTGATKCAYCGNPVIVPKVFADELKPDYVIPFKVDQKQALAKLKASVKGKVLVPKQFKDENKLLDITGVYVPFWFFDSTIEAALSYKATNVISWSDAKYIYTKTDIYHVIREGEISFAKVPADASKAMVDRYMDAIEPYDYHELKPFTTAYLTGFQANKYDVLAEEVIDRVNDRMKTSTTDTFAQTVVGYQSVVNNSCQIDLKDNQLHYALLPVWILNIQYQGKKYMYAVNGQTGKFVGEWPMDKKKLTLIVLAMLVIGLTIAAIIAFGLV